MTHLKQAEKCWSLVYDLPFYAEKTLLGFVWFSEILSLSNYFQSPYSFKKEKNHFPTKYRGLGNG